MPSHGSRLYARLPDCLKDVVDEHLFAEVRAWRCSHDYLNELAAGLMEWHAVRLRRERDGCASVEECVAFLRKPVTSVLREAFVPVTALERGNAQWIAMRRAMRRISDRNPQLSAGRRSHKKTSRTLHFRYMAYMAMIWNEN